MKQLPFLYSNALFSPTNDLFLKVSAKIVEIITISGDPNDQIPVIFGMHLCVPKNVSRNHIKLNMVTIQSKIATDKLPNLGYS